MININMSVLSDQTIFQELLKGNIIIHPFNPSNVSNSSYDVTLGQYYYTEEIIDHTINPWNEEHTKKVWKGPNEALKLRHDTLINGYNVDDEVIIIPPSATILAHTNEFIGGKHNITSMMKARSSIGRMNLTICNCAGWGDIGYYNRYTMEITNKSKTNSIGLIVGKRIGQIIFFRTDECTKTYNGKYQNEDNLISLINQWVPSMMLPRLFLDKY
jgi:dCTP deaminase